MKIIFNKLNLKILILLGLFFLVILSGVTYVVGVGSYDTGYNISTGSGAQNMYISDGTCKKVTNNSGLNLFIPTRTAAEWNAFVANKPSGVTVEECCDAASTCSGHGTCTTSGTCSCNAGYSGTSCNSCASDYFSYPTCTYCTAASTCSGHGTCSSTGSCICSTDNWGYPYFYGPNCNIRCYSIADCANAWTRCTGLPGDYTCTCDNPGTTYSSCYIEWTGY